MFSYGKTGFRGAGDDAKNQPARLSRRDLGVQRGTDPHLR